MKINTRRFVALDRDGTIVEERVHLSDPSDLVLIPGAALGLKQMSDLGLGLVVVTNQSVVARGYLDQVRLDTIHKTLQDMLASQGVDLDGIFYCPHQAEDDCSCRKPKPGLLQMAAQQLDFNLRTSFLIGDKASDIEAGQRVGATTLLVRTGYGYQVVKEGTVNPDYIVSGLSEAAQIICNILDSEARLIAREARR